jgi:hypothetical protein
VVCGVELGHLEGLEYLGRYNNCDCLSFLHAFVVSGAKSQIEAIGILTRLDGSLEACCRYS